MVSTELHAERAVERAIRRRGMAAWVPKFRGDKQMRLLFPRYVFMQADLATSAWQGLYTERGVDTLLGFRGERPSPVPIGVLEALWLDCLPNGVVRSTRATPHQRPVDVPPGAIVSIENGQFVGWEGVCLWSSATRIAVLLSVMGREIKVQMPRDAAQPA